MLSRLSPSSHLDVWLALPLCEAAVWGFYTAGAVCFGDSLVLRARICVCVSGPVSVEMCMCRMKCRLPPMRHTHTLLALVEGEAVV